MKRWARGMILCLLALSLQGAMCQEIYTHDGTWYRVRSGDTLNTIATRFGVSTQRIAHTNKISGSDELQPGERIYIPNSGRTYAARDTSNQKASGTTASEASSKSGMASGKFNWPVAGQLTSAFGVRNGRRHDGIDIAAPRGTPVKASQDGEVVFSSRLRGYGNLILIKHPGDMFTVYAHNSRNLKEKGSKVKQGDVIARVGTTGRSTGPHVHFEIRKGSKATNPLPYLPSRETKMASSGATGGP